MNGDSLIQLPFLKLHLILRGAAVRKIRQDPLASFVQQAVDWAALFMFFANVSKNMRF